MPIIRTSQVDDDGSGTTGTIWNNAWKTELYNQIDGATGNTVVPWTITDASGAGLVFGTASAYYTVVGKTVLFWFAFQFPSTANTAAARFTGIPPNTGPLHGGGFMSFGHQSMIHVPANNSFLYVTNSGGSVTNAMLSSIFLIGQGQYLLV